ncbi:28S ribosomal protein S9, mitochondrial [Nylanderia fulva]|uniref:28S ribosomal protein S9, mitochondrial n=1 Tax=Nylanderia fulva TaxID=613905 RepID=UPI0010FB62DC|nr:28S ribosomal protein S9, mitochondrial [Nylanderia fulva]
MNNENHVQRVISRSYTTPTTDQLDEMLKFDDEVTKPAKKMSKAMIMYLQRAKDHNEFMKKEIVEYEIGKRHLANMMGEDPDFFTQADIDKSIEYLFPSGLYDRKARPIMRHPEEIFPSRKAAEFDETGRPFHSMFYTSRPNYYQILYEIVEKIKSLNDIEDSLIRQGTLPMDKIDLIGFTWLSKKDMEDKLLETLQDMEYNYFITSLERLCEHPLSKRETDFIMKYRKILISHSNEITIPPLEHDSTGRPYITVKNCIRKSARGVVTVWGNGSGNITINGQDITYFKDIQHREQN